jgi:hypothetical protein
MKQLRFLAIALIGISPQLSYAQQGFNGIDMNLGNLYKVSDARSRSILKILRAKKARGAKQPQARVLVHPGSWARGGK